MNDQNTGYDFGHRKDIQGLRGLAVLLVVLYHAGLPVPGGFVGVDVFFVISGFVITGGILKTLNSEKGFSFKEFYVRRVRRLLPALSVVLTLGILLGIVFGPEISQKVSGRTAVAAALVNANHYLYRSGGYFEPAAEKNVFLHTWSLSVEEQFYLFFPFFIVLLWWGARRAKKSPLTTTTIGVVALTLTSLTLSTGLTYTATFGLDAPRVAFFSSVTRAWEFGIGALLALLLPWFRTYPRNWIWVGWAGLGMVLVASFVYSEDTAFPGFAALLPAIGTGLVLLPGLNGATNAFTRLFSSRLLARMGDLSYSWYLWHWPLIVFTYASWPGDPTIAVVIAALGSIGLAWLTERAIESPIRYRAEAERRPVWQVATLCIVAPIVAWIIQIQSPLITNHIKPVAQLREMGRVYVEIGCDSSTPYDPTSSTCKWGEGKERKIVLLGDSNASQFIPVLRSVSEELGVTFQAATFSGCPVSQTPIYRNRVRFSSCEEWVAKSLEQVLKERPDVLIISIASDLYTMGRAWAFEDSKGNRVVTPQQRLLLLSEELEEITKLTKGLNIQLVLIDPIPKFLANKHDGIPKGERYGRDCSHITLLLYPKTCAPSRKIEDRRFMDPNRGGEVNMRAEGHGAIRINLEGVLCPKGDCSSYSNGWLYMDGGHLSVVGAEKVREVLLQELRSTLMD